MLRTNCIFSTLIKKDETGKMLIDNVLQAIRAKWPKLWHGKKRTSFTFNKIMPNLMLLAMTLIWLTLLSKTGSTSGWQINHLIARIWTSSILGSFEPFERYNIKSRWNLSMIWSPQRKRLLNQWIIPRLTTCFYLCSIAWEKLWGATG